MNPYLYASLGSVKCYPSQGLVNAAIVEEQAQEAAMGGRDAPQPKNYHEVQGTYDPPNDNKRRRIQPNNSMSRSV